MGVIFDLGLRLRHVVYELSITVAEKSCRNWNNRLISVQGQKALD